MSDKEKNDGPKHDTNKSPVSFRRAKKLLVLKEFLSKQESRNKFKKVSRALKKSEEERTAEEQELVAQNETIVKRIHKNKERKILSEQRVLETEDNEETIQAKCHQLAEAIQQSKRTVIYTGAGISTAASIPDYRGPQGVWTLLQKGEQLQPQDLSDAEPTVTHMCITELYHRGHVKHVVSQNCDGLHVRSGLPRRFLSEVHGNMYIEVCYKCKPHREYMRLFDVTENTGVRRHHTSRLCLKCGGKLRDTIVHFGEKGDLRSPYRWKEAARIANKCDLILCLGSSLKILKKYACLWCMDRVKNKRPNLVIVNLQWTPKDDAANLKINGRCDDILQRVMTILGYPIPVYSRLKDPIFRLATPLSRHEKNSFSKKILQRPEGLPWENSCGLTSTPSSSEDSQSSSSSTSTDSSPSHELSVTDDHVKSIPIAETTREVKKEPRKEPIKYENKEAEFLSKSQKICDDAKKAMQSKLCNNKIGKVSHASINSSQQFSHSSSSSAVLTTNSKCSYPYSVPYNGCSKSSVPVITPYDPHGTGIVPTAVNYEQQLMHLHALQGQLQALKEKQEMLKQQESQRLQIPTSPLKHTLNSPQSKQSPNHSPSKSDNYGIAQLLGIDRSAGVKKEQPNEEQKKQNIGACECEGTNVLSLEQKQKLCNDEIRQQQEKFQRQIDLLKRQQENDHMRLYQHFLIQQQILEQTSMDATKTSELMQIFLQQQQLLIAQQNMQRLELQKAQEQKYAALMNDLMSRNQNSGLQLGYQNVRNDTQLLSPVKPLSPSSFTSQSYSISSILSSPKPKGLVTSASVVIGTPTIVTDSHVAVAEKTTLSLAGKDQKKVNETKDQSVCESCKFLKNYGIVKQRCAQCIAMSPKCPISTSTSVKDPSRDTRMVVKTNKVPNVKPSLGLPIADIKTETIATSKAACTTLSSTVVSKPDCDMIQGIATAATSRRTSMQTPNYLISGRTVSKEGESDVCKMNAPTNHAKVGRCGDDCSRKMESPAVVKFELGLINPVIEDENDDKPLGKSIKRESIDSVTCEDVGKLVKNEKLQEDGHTLGIARTMRSHSQSEIYDKDSIKHESRTSDTRYARTFARSFSQSELSQLDSKDSIEKVPSLNGKSAEINIKGTSKRKLSATVNVPGWFGKGLNMKKRKRY